MTENINLMLDRCSTKNMNEVKKLLLIGGTGFIGRAVAEKYLNNGWQLIITTKSLSIKDAKNKLILHGFDTVQLEKFIANKSLLFITGADLSNKRWLEINTWLNVFKEINLSPISISRIINLAAEISGPADKIIRSSMEILSSVLTIARNLKSQNKNIVFCNMGSTAERRRGKNLPPYEFVKKIIRQKIEESRLCDYHFVVNYVKGKGEQRMTIAAPFLWEKLKWSYRWLFGFKISIIDVDDLADIVYEILEIIKIPSEIKNKKLLLEVNTTSGELPFGEMIKNLLPRNQRIIPEAVIPFWLEKYFLKTYAFIVPLIKSKNQTMRRLAHFAKIASLGKSDQDRLKSFKTAEEIKKLALDKANYITLEKKPTLIIIDNYNPVIYALREKTEDQLKQIVQKSI